MTEPDLAITSGLEGAIARLAEAADAAAVLGLSTDDARSVVAQSSGRLGFPAEVYVLALVGGTGVGKSSLLNALAGSAVSPASAHRPTTERAVAWVPAASRADLEGLLTWLDVREVRVHDRPALDSMAILDLPDMDSIATEHRQRVEEILPRVDAVAWVTDPEKYHDAVLHDAFLRTWLPRLERQAFVLNKTDRLAPDDRTTVRHDLEQDVARDRSRRGGASSAIPVLATTATAGESGVGELLDWLASGVEAKRVVRARLAASLAAAAERLARAAGIDSGSESLAPLLGSTARTNATDGVIAAVLHAIDLPGLERQAVAATRAQARRRGTGPMGLVTSIIYRWSGRAARVADPAGFLVRWRDRGPLTPAVESLRLAMAEPLRTVVPALRPALAASVEPAQLQPSLAAAVDRAVARHDRTVPSSRLWPVFGFLQTLATVAIALSVVWVVLWVVARPPVDSVDVPVLGTVPMPFMALVVSLGIGYVLARVLGVLAGWVGRRWAGRLRRGIAAAVAEEMARHGLEPLDRLEAARQTVWAATRDVISAARRI